MTSSFCDHVRHKKCGDVTWRQRYVDAGCMATFAKQALTDHGSLVVWSMSDRSWLPAIENWVASVRRLLPSSALAAAVSLDEAAAKSFALHGVNAVLHYCAGCSGPHAGPNFLLLKVLVTLAFLEHGASRVLFSEMDVFWRSPPLQLEDPRYDFQVRCAPSVVCGCAYHD